MPQEEETSRDDGSAESPSPDESGRRDRIFTQFSEVTEVGKIIASFRELCQEAEIDPGSYEKVYPGLKKCFKAWKPASVWELLDKRACLPEYESGNACRGSRVLVVGAGPVGLRMALEAALLGARVDLVEKRSDFTRNNSLHLWPFLITDLRNLGAKKFYGKFATGSLDHICIRILQGILMKVCLLLGVRVHVNACFTNLIEPTPNSGWKVSIQPPSCPANTFEFEAILAADGKKNSLPGFTLKEFRAKLALAITANFVNGNTQHENSVPEISGVSYVYRMDFFNSLKEKFGIELENIVYYKDETHYFVMTAKKPSLLRKGVLKQDYNDPKQLLSKTNIDITALKKYTIEAAQYSTEGALPLTFEKNHRGEDDVALFDFTSLFASENAARIVERKGRKVLLCVAGDSLNEPFWPTGSGCGRGFLGAFDAVWMLKRFCAGTSPLELVEEREALFYLLPQTTPERLAKNLTGYTIDPKTRYPNLSELVPPGDVSYLYDTDAKPHPLTYQQRQPPPIQESVEKAPTRLVKAASVSGGFSANKRSRSSEGLSAIAESTPAAVASPAKHADSSLERESHGASPASQRPTSLRKRIEILEAKEGRRHGSGRPKSTSRSEQKEASIKPNNKSVSPAPASPEKPEETVKLASSSPKSKQKGKNKTVSPAPASPEKQEEMVKLAAASSPKSKRIFRLFERSKSKSPSPTPSSDDEIENTEKRKPKVTKITESKTKSHEETQPKTTKHPLTVAKQARTHSESPKKQDQKLDERSVENDQNQASVADIVKRLDPQQPSTEQPTGKKKKKEKTKKEIKTNEKQYLKGSTSQSQEGDNESKSGRFRSFFRSKKSYDVAKASSPTGKTSLSPKAKKKRKSKSEREQVHQLAQKPPLSLQERIQRLKDLGVGNMETDTDSPDMILSLEELNDLEARSGLLLNEKEQVKERSRSVSPGYSEEGLVTDSSRSRSTTPVYSSSAEEQRPQSRSSHLSSAATCGSVRGVSPMEWKDGSHSGEEVQEEDSLAGQEYRGERKASVVETVQQLEPLSAACSIDQMITMKKAEERKSKEFELAELHSKSKVDDSSPLWLARIIQGLGKCLEKLRREQNDILATKTTLQIISTILSNVQLHPSDDTYRRVRVSSQRFNQKVWQFSNAGQFLARAGWVEIGDYIVLPIGQNVDNAKRVLEKHLNIVNQMLWSQQLELPDSPGVLKKLQAKRHGVTPRNRALTAAMTAKRQSYSSQLVTESIKEVEEEQEAMEAVLVRMSSTQDRDKESSPDHFDASQDGNEKEEVRTMKAASAARKKWQERQRKESLDQRRDREYKLILESELYDLPQSNLQIAEFTAAKSTSPVPSYDLSITPDPRSTSPSSPSPSHQGEFDSQEEVKESLDVRQGDETDANPSSINPVASASPTQTTDAQYSTPDSIRQDMMKYEKITMEAAAQVRQKWTET